MFYRKYCLLSLLFTLMVCSGNLIGQNVFSHIYNYNFRNGLSFGVMDMATDKEGNLWFKDHNTVGKYNGNKFSYYYHAEGQDGSCPLFVTDLCTDLQEALWLAAGDGIFRYSKSKGFIPYRLINKPGETIFGFVTLSVNAHNHLWCGNTNGRVILYDPVNNKIERALTMPEKDIVRKIFESKDGQVWIASNDGFYVLNTKNEIHKVYHFGIRTTYPDDNLFKIIRSSNGNIFVNFKTKLLEFNESSHALVREYTFGHLRPEDHVNDFHELNPRIFQIASTNGFFTYDRMDNRVFKMDKPDFPKEYAIESDHINTIFYSKNNILFLGTSKGMSKMQQSAEQFTNFDLGHNLNSKVTLISNIEKWENRWLVVTGSDGIFQYSPKSQTVTKCPSFRRKNITNAFISTDKNTLYWTEGQGLFRGRIESNSIDDIRLLKTFPNVEMRLIKKDRDDHFWIADKNRVYYYNTAADLLKTFNTPIADIKDMVVEENTGALIGGLGLYTIDQNGKTEKIPIKTSEIIHALAFGQKDEIYAGAYSGLLIFNRKTNTTQKLSQKTGLLRDYTGNLIKCGKYMWVTFLEGLQRMDMETKKFDSYSFEDGLADNYSLEHIGIVDSATIYLGKFGYFTYQEKVSGSPLSGASFSLDGVYLDGKAVEGDFRNGQQIIVPANIKKVKLDFAFTAYLEPTLYELQYRLKSERDSTWNQVNHDLTLEFSELIPNSYQLELRAIDKSDTSYKKTYGIHLLISTPFYKTLWFQLIVFLVTALILAAIFYAIYRFKTNQLKQLENLRLSISRDLHDEMGSTISSIKLLSEFEVSREKHPSNSSYRKIALKSSEIMEGMSDIVWSINPANDNMTRIIEKIQSYAIDVLEPLDVNVLLKFDESLTHLSLNLDKRRNLYLIFKESINNISKYAHASNVVIELYQHKNNIVGSIADDGVGYDPPAVKYGNGIENMNHRATLLSGVIHVKSVLGEGTEIKLEFPI